MNPAYIIALFQFIFFPYYLMQLEDIRRNQIFHEELLEFTIMKNLFEDGIYDLGYLENKNFECYSIIIQEKNGKEKLDKDCQCFHSKVIGNKKIRFPYRWSCNTIPAQWKKLGGQR